MSETGAIRKNTRPSLVCANCRRRKVKCDRTHPCTRCIKSKIGESCFYDNIPDSSMVDDHGNEYDNESIETNSTDSKMYDGDKSLLSPTQALSRMNSRVFNFPTMEYKRPLFIKNGGLLFYKSPLTLGAITNNNKAFYKFENMLSYLFASKELDDYSTRLEDEARLELMLLYGIYSKDEIDDLIIQFVIPNINAINERLDYFRTDLEDKSLCSFIPSHLLIEKFNKLFTVTNNGEIFCKRFDQKSDYSILTPILGIVKLVLMITQYDTAIRFQYVLTFDNEKTTEILLKVLSFSDYKNKPNFNLLVGFLIYRMTFFLSDSISTSSNSDFFFDLTVNMCFKLGIHLNCNQIDEYDEETVRGVWNVVQFIDSIGAIYTGDLLKIDHRYCVPRFYEFFEPIVSYFRQFVSLFNSISPISLNQIIDLAENAIRLFSIFKPYDVILNDVPNGPTRYMFVIILKADFLICFQISLLIIRLSLDNLDTVPFEFSANDLRLIDEYKNKAEVLLFYSSVLTFELLRKVSNGKISDRLQSAKLTISLRLFFSRFLAINNKIIFAHLSTINRYQQRQNNIDSISSINDFNNSKKFCDITLAEAEEYLARGFEGVKETDIEFKTMKELMRSIPKLSDFLMEIYLSTSDKSILVEIGRFNIHFKFLLFVCILLKNAHEYYESKSYEDVNYQINSEDWKTVIDKTTTYFTNVENKGYGISDQQESAVNVFVSDWEFLESTEFRNTLGYKGDGGDGEKSNVELDEMYQLFFG